MLGGPAAEQGSMLGGGGGPMGAGGQMSGGGPGGQVSIVIQMGMEIDMKLKQMGQMLPLLMPWAQSVGEQLKIQIAQAMQGGQMGAPVMPAQGAEQFPDGSGRM